MIYLGSRDTYEEAQVLCEELGALVKAMDATNACGIRIQLIAGAYGVWLVRY